MLNHAASLLSFETDSWAGEGQHGLVLDDGNEIRSSDMSDSSASARADLDEIAIFFATETGSSEDVAMALSREAKARGLVTKAQDIGDLDLTDLTDVHVALFVTSTTGEGEIPYTAEGFFQEIEGDDAPDLSGMRFAVLALGDSTYELFCEAGKRLDRTLEAAGGERIFGRVDCDVDYEGPAAQWRDAVLTQLAGAPSQDARAVEPTAPEKNHLFPARIIENRVLNGPGSSKATRHIALAFVEETPDYAVGDALGLVVDNDEELVTAVLDAAGLDGDQEVDAGDCSMPLRQALRERYQITALAPRFIEGWAQLAGVPELAELLSDSTARMVYMAGHHVFDVLRIHRVPKLDVNAFLALLRPLQPRLYSIASCLEATPGEVHLTVAPVVYELHGMTRRGVATGQLSMRAPFGTDVQVYVHHNEHFRLPPPEVPIIMIGPGTGIAPFRAFLQERALHADAGPAWLIFGERNRHCDFLYESEMKGFLDRGVLTRLDTAFSRDGAEKDYVQHRLLEHAAELVNWIEAAAHIYVCGDAGMANDVQGALVAAIANARNVDAEAAGEILSTMRREKRYQRDVY